MALAVTFGSAPAAAHFANQSYLYLDVSTQDLSGRVELPYSDMREVLGLRLEQPPESVLAELEANRDRIIEYLHAHTAIGVGSTEWPMVFGDFELLADGVEVDGLAFAVFPFEVDVPIESVPRQLNIGFDPFFSELEGRDGVVALANDWQRGVFDEEKFRLVVLDADKRSDTVDLGNPSQWLNFTGSISLGVDHIRTGADHVFFVLVLLLPSVLIFASAWKPAPSFGAALWRVMKIVSMFTVAHSITFTIAGLELIPLPPSRFVESVIALSIAAAAIHNLRPVFLNQEWLMAFLFGLFHGLGFATLVDSLDVGRSTQLVSLLGRNVGIELGQVVVILVAFPALYLLRRTSWYQPLLTIGSIVLAVLSVSWMIERVFDTDIGTDGIVEGLVQLPRGYAIAALATVVAIGVRTIEDRRQQLQPVAES